MLLDSIITLAFLHVTSGRALVFRADALACKADAVTVDFAWFNVASMVGRRITITVIEAQRCISIGYATKRIIFPLLL